MPVIVTGAAGFIGRHLTVALAERGYEVVGVDRRTDVPAAAAMAVTADLSEGSPLVDDVLSQADAVFHLAGAAGVRGGEPDVEVRRRRDNVEATRRVLDAVPLSVPVVVTSSSSVYGGAGDRPSRETDAVRPRGGYARSKVEVERACARRVSRGGHVAVARPFTVAGEHQRADMAIATWLRAAREGRPVRVLGGLQRTRDVTDVRDVVEGLVRMAERGVRSTVNLGTGRGITLGRLVAAVARAVGADPDLLVTPAGDDEPRHTLADTTRCERLLGFAPITDIDALVRRQLAAEGRTALEIR